MSTIEGNYFVCIGAQKAGTRWLHDNLNGHPEIWVPPIKEIHYFDGMHIQAHRGFLDKLVAKARSRAAASGPMNEDERAWYTRYGAPDPLGDEWYVSLFADAAGARAFGEITPAYSMLPDEGFAHLARLAPQGRVIFIMREPMSRVWSHIRFHSRKPKHSSVLQPEEAIAFANKRQCEARTTYERTMDRLEAHFPRDRILYLFYEDISADGLTELRKVCEFLQVRFDTEYFPQAAERLNVSVAAEMPPALRTHLQRKYAYLPDIVEARVGRIPSEWRSPDR